MADKAFDGSEWDALFAQMEGPMKESLARRMGVAGGKLIRDEAKLRAPVGVAEEKAARQFGGSLKPGSLRDAIYLAYSNKRSFANAYTYTVSWNGSKFKGAPHGHLLEFGHWQPYLVVYSKEKGWRTTKKLLPQPKWVRAYPFLGPAWAATKGRAFDVMVEKGRAELPGLLKDKSGEATE